MGYLAGAFKTEMDGDHLQATARLGAPSFAGMSDEQMTSALLKFFEIISRDMVKTFREAEKEHHGTSAD